MVGLIEVDQQALLNYVTVLSSIYRGLQRVIMCNTMNPTRNPVGFLKASVVKVAVSPYERLSLFRANDLTNICSLTSESIVQKIFLLSPLPECKSQYRWIPVVFQQNPLR